MSCESTETALLKMESVIADLNAQLSRCGEIRRHAPALHAEIVLHRQLAEMHLLASLLWKVLAEEYAEQTARTKHERRT
jgi:hypothetical protein